MCQPKIRSGNADASKLVPNADASKLAMTCMVNINKTAPLRILLVSENVAPQVNGIARRVTHYAEGLRDLGCDVDLLSPESVDSSGRPAVLPFVNPWNFTAQMFVIRPLYFLTLAFVKSLEYDVVHVVLPANLSGLLLLSAFRLARVWNRGKGPSLVVSWHCNLMDYAKHIIPAPLVGFVKLVGLCGVGIFPLISDRLLTPTKATEPVLTKLYGDDRHGVCYTGMSKTNFNPKMKYSEWGQVWQRRKKEILAKTGKKHLLVCVGRVSPEKGVDELLQTMPLLNDCVLWLVGDGPARGALEALADRLDIPVKFWGYQRGDALHAVYTVADCFVCPSLTETFGQTVNEAIASEVPIALPAVHVFKEAYGEWLPEDAMWEPLDRAGMALAIQNQLARGDSAVANPSKLKSWSDACQILLADYHKASQDRQRISLAFHMVILPWWALTVTSMLVIFIFSQVRALFGGSVRHFFKTAFRKACEDGPRKQSKELILLVDPVAGLSWYLTKSNRAYSKPRLYFNTIFLTVVSVTMFCNPPHFIRI